MFNWLDQGTTWFVYNFFGVKMHSAIGEMIHFFIYDTVKIFILLVVIVYIMTLVNQYLPINKIRDFLTKRKRYGLDHLLASLFGTITPFCSCSSIPLFVGFLKSGIPLGVILSFLITSPLVNEVAVALFLGIFGVKITLIYVGVGILLGTFGGLLLGKIGLEKYVAPFIQKSIQSQKQQKPNQTNTINNTSNIKNTNNTNKETKKSFITIQSTVIKDSWTLIKKIFPYVVIGVGLGAIIHGYIPTNFFEKYLARDSRYGVPLAVLLGVPMYTNASGVIPVVQSLIAKGVPLGTGLAFMMAVVGLSLPEFLILKKVMQPKLLFSFFGIVTIFIIIIGFLFNIFL